MTDENSCANPASQADAAQAHKEKEQTRKLKNLFKGCRQARKARPSGGLHPLTARLRAGSQTAKRPCKNGKALRH